MGAGHDSNSWDYQRNLIGDGGAHKAMSMHSVVTCNQAVKQMFLLSSRTEFLQVLPTNATDNAVLSTRQISSV